MPALKNQLHEKFCQIFSKGTLQGLTQGEIYSLAGGSTGSKNSAEVLASRLLKRPDILARLAEMGKPATKQAMIDSKNLLDKAEHVYQKAKDNEGTLGHANRAIEIQGKLTGALVERSEISQHFDFGELNTVQDLARVMLRDNTVEGARALCDELILAMEQIAAEEAQDVTLEPKRDQRDRRALDYLKSPNGRGR